MVNARDGLSGYGIAFELMDAHVLTCSSETLGVVIPEYLYEGRRRDQKDTVGLPARDAVALNAGVA